MSEQSSEKPHAPVDEGCICRGNWRLIVNEYRAFIGKRYRDHKGQEWSFFGLVHGDDDYYYGMFRKGESVLLSCVGSIEGHGYELVDAPIVAAE